MLRWATKGAAYAGRTFSISMYLSSEDVRRMQVRKSNTDGCKACKIVTQSYGPTQFLA